MYIAQDDHFAEFVGQLFQRLAEPRAGFLAIEVDGGTVIRMAVDDIRRMGRSTQGVIVMRLREGEEVSSLAPVVESGDDEQE